MQEMLDAAIIVPAPSAWSFPVMIATKSDWYPRFYVDYRTFNQVTNTDRWLLPKIEKISDDLQRGKNFKILDLFFEY